jgi:nucleoid DNA-binding protein
LAAFSLRNERHFASTASQDRDWEAPEACIWRNSSHLNNAIPRLTTAVTRVIPGSVRSELNVTNNLMTLTKRDLVTRISNETGLVQQQVLDVVQKTLDYIAEALAKGDKVELRNFGVFEVKVRKARIGRNPNAPETDVPIPERSVVKFKPGKEMRAEVLKLGAKAASQPPQA